MKMTSFVDCFRVISAMCCGLFQSNRQQSRCFFKPW